MLRQLRKPIAVALKAVARPNFAANAVPIVSRISKLQGSQIRCLSTVPAERVQSLINEVSKRQQESAATVVPWFLNNMPVRQLVNVYFYICLTQCFISPVELILSPNS